MVYSFGQFELDEERCELRRGGHTVKTEPQVFRLLSYLIHHRDRLVSRDELLEQLWPSEFVSDSALSYCIKAARKAVGDDGQRQQVIETMARRGFRFVPDVCASSPVAAAVGQSAAAIGAEPPVSETLRDTFVGREHELRALNAGLQSAFGGHGRLFLLVGEPGIGKTRTAEVFAAAARAKGAQVLIGRCHEGDGAPAFWPWIQVLRAHTRVAEPARPRRSRRLAAPAPQPLPDEVNQLLGASPLPPDWESPHARFHLFESVSRFLHSAAARQPLVIILDDLHWADAPSLLLLEFLAQEIGATRLLIVAIYRDSDIGPGHALTDSLGALVRIDACQRLELIGLSKADVAAYLERVAGTQPEAALVNAVHSRTEGNPFFVAEVVQLMGSGAGRGAEANLVPPTVREAIRRRLRRMSPLCSSVLRTAAVMGRDFGLRSLRRVWQATVRSGRHHPADGDAVLKVLEEARAARLIEDVDAVPGTFRFVHALIRETLYEDLERPERVKLHRRIGMALEAGGRRRGSQLALLAHHFTQAAHSGDARKAITYSIAAAKYAAAQLAFEEAAIHYERALHIVSETKPRAAQRIELLLSFGTCLWRAGDFARARAVFLDAANAARSGGSPEQFARAAVGYGGGFRGFNFGVHEPVLVELLREALERLPQRESFLRAQVLARTAIALYAVPESMPQRDKLSRSAIEMAKRVGDDATLIGTLYIRHWATWSPDNLDARRATAEAMVQLAERSRNAELELQARRFRAVDALEGGDVATFDADLAACAAIAERLHQPYYTWYVSGFRALRAFFDGDLVASERSTLEAMRVGESVQSQNVSQAVGAQMVVLRREQGRIAEVEPIFRGLVSQHPTVPSWRCGLAYVLSEAGRLDEARRHFDALAAEDFAGIPRDTFWLVAMSALSDVCAALGDRARAALLYRLVEPFSTRMAVNVVGTCSTSMARSAACLAVTIARFDMAMRHFEQALALEERLSARPLLAHSQQQYADALLARGRPSDTSYAVALLERARSQFEQMGMATFAARAENSLAQARSFAAPKSRKTVALLRRG